MTAAIVEEDGGSPSEVVPHEGDAPAVHSCTRCGWTSEPGQLWPSHGGIAVEWIETYLVFAEGDWEGKPFTLRPDQQEFLYEWYEYCGGCGQWHYDEALRGAASGDGKTAFIAAIACLELAGPEEISPKSPNIAIAAASLEQANNVFGAASLMLGGRQDEIPDAPLIGLFDIQDQEVNLRDRPGRMYRVAAESKTNEGGLPHLFIADELHVWGDINSRTADVHNVIGKSTRKRNTAHGSGRILNISTAGFDVDGSLLGQMYKLGQQTLIDPSVAPRFLFRWFEAPDGLDFEKPTDREIAVRAASPGAGVQFSIADRVNDWNKPSYPHHKWIRYNANKWTGVPHASWLAEHPKAWGECEDRSYSPTPELPFTLGVDLSWSRDRTAVVRCERLPDGRTGVTAKVWTPADGRIPHLEVKRHIAELCRLEGFRSLAYDPTGMELMSEQLEEEERIDIVPFSQQPAKMIPAVGYAFELITNHQLVHDGDPVLADHIRSAIRYEQKNGFTIGKNKKAAHPKPVDAAVALCIGAWVLEQEMTVKKIKPNVWVF